MTMTKTKHSLFCTQMAFTQSGIHVNPLDANVFLYKNCNVRTQMAFTQSGMYVNLKNAHVFWIKITRFAPKWLLPRVAFM